MKKNPYEIQHHFFPSNRQEIIKKLGKETLLKNLQRMLLIRNFEIRAEAAYLQGKIGGFFHSYMGQEAIQTAVLQVIGPKLVGHLLSMPCLGVIARRDTQ